LSIVSCWAFEAGPKGDRANLWDWYFAAPRWSKREGSDPIFWFFTPSASD